LIFTPTLFAHLQNPSWLIALTMKNFDNDNDELSFTRLGALTLNVVRYLESSKDQQRDGERQTPDQRSEEEKAKDRAEAVNEGMRQIERFERRYRRGDRS
jgi:hypothetical protein